MPWGKDFRGRDICNFRQYVKYLGKFVYEVFQDIQWNLDKSGSVKIIFDLAQRRIVAAIGQQ